MYANLRPSCSIHPPVACSDQWPCCVQYRLPLNSKSICCRSSSLSSPQPQPQPQLTQRQQHTLQRHPSRQVKAATNGYNKMSPGRRILLALLGGHVFLMASCRAHDDLGGPGMVAAESNQVGGNRATKSLFPKRHGRSRKLAKKGGGGNGNGAGNGHGHGGYNEKEGGKGGGKKGGHGGGHGGSGGGDDHNDPDCPIFVELPPGSGATPGGPRPLCSYTLDPSTDCSTPQGPPGDCTRECLIHGTNLTSTSVANAARVSRITVVILP